MTRHVKTAEDAKRKARRAERQAGPMFVDQTNAFTSFSIDPATTAGWFNSSLVALDASGDLSINWEGQSFSAGQTVVLDLATSSRSQPPWRTLALVWPACGSRAAAGPGAGTPPRHLTAAVPLNKHKAPNGGVDLHGKHPASAHADAPLAWFVTAEHTFSAAAFGLEEFGLILHSFVTMMKSNSSAILNPYSVSKALTPDRDLKAI